MAVIKTIDFINNIAKISGNSVYQDVSQFCTSGCLYNMGINHDFVNTPPNELKFNDPATCIDADNDTRTTMQQLLCTESNAW